MMTSPRVLILGGGAIGSLLAARLARAGQSVALAARPHTAEAARRQGGIRLVEPAGEDAIWPVPVYPSLAHAWEEAGPFSCIMLAVKGYHTADAAREIHEVGAEGVPLLTIQNGVGNEEALAQALPASPILAGVLTTPVQVLAPAAIRVTRPSYHFGLAPGPGGKPWPPAVSILSQAGFQLTQYQDYRSLKWSKLLMNILANAQSAILGYTPAQIFADSRLGNLELRAWREALEVMQALGIRPVSVGGYPLPLAARAVQRLPLGLMRPLFARFIVSGRGEKMPSLYYDLHPQPRPHSEIHWLNGAVARAAAQHHLAAPVNTAFTRIMDALLRGEEDLAAWEGHPERLLASIAALEEHEG